jgi:hypothetical protein
VVSVAARARPARLISPPAVAVFDGSRSYLRWSGTYPDANWLIILDRNERRFTDAIDAVNALYTMRIGDRSPITVKSPPLGIECVSFEIRRAFT